MVDNGALVNRVFDESGRRLHSILFRLTLRADCAEELLQDLVVRLLASRQFAEAQSPEAFAVRAAVRLGIDWRRQQGRRKRWTGHFAEVGDVADATVDAAGRAQQAELWETVLSSVCRLPDAQREPIVLHYLEGQSYEHIATEMGTTPHRVRALCHKGLAGVRKLLGQEPKPLTEFPDVPTRPH